MTARFAIGLTALASALVLVAACGSRGDAKAGASCDAAGARFLAVARAQLAARSDADATVRAGIEGLLAPMRDGMVRACREGTWSPATRDCFAGAADDAAMKACYGQLSPEQQQALATSTAGDTAPGGPR